MYQVNMLCKHFKGKDLIEKNIYRIIGLNVDPKTIDFNVVTYSGDNDPMQATDLVLYANIFQDNKLFTREYSDIASELDDDKKELFGQSHKVEPLTEEEIKIVTSEAFRIEKSAYMESKKSK